MVQWLRMQALGMEVLGSNSGHDQLIFFQHFYVLFMPPSDCSIRVSRSRNFTLARFLLYNSVAVSLLQVIPLLGLPCSCDKPFFFFYMNKCS